MQIINKYFVSIGAVNLKWCFWQQELALHIFTKNYFSLDSVSGFGHFVTSGSNFRQLFPGIRSKLCTLNFHFFVPVFREVALGWGMLSASKNNIKYALSQSNAVTAECNADGFTSNAVCVLCYQLNRISWVWSIVLLRLWLWLEELKKLSMLALGATSLCWNIEKVSSSLPFKLEHQ